MGLRDTLAKAADSAFKALGDIPESATYRRTTNTYNPATGSSVDVDSDFTLDVIFTSYQNFEIDRVAILSTDVKAIIKTADMTGLIPSASADMVIRSNGEEFHVLRYSEDPAGATYSIQLRAKG